MRYSTEHHPDGLPRLPNERSLEKKISIELRTRFAGRGLKSENSLVGVSFVAATEIGSLYVLQFSLEFFMI